MSTTPRRSIRRALGTLAVAVLLFTGCAGADGEAEPSEPSTGSQSASEDAAADLEASAPDGKYAASYVVTSANIPGAKVGFKSTSTYAFKVGECTDTECTGTVRAPAKGSWTWDGTELVITFDKLDKVDSCVDEAGEKVKGDTFRVRTEHQARLTAAGEGEGEGTPAMLEGNYQQEAVYSEFRNGCTPDGPKRQRAELTLTLRRK